MTLKDTLYDKVIIEYPTFYIYLPDTPLPTGQLITCSLPNIHTNTTPNISPTTEPTPPSKRHFSEIEPEDEDEENHLSEHESLPNVSCVTEMQHDLTIHDSSSPHTSTNSPTNPCSLVVYADSDQDGSDSVDSC
jgi:hypothetical protein